MPGSVLGKKEALIRSLLRETSLPRGLLGLTTGSGCLDTEEATLPETGRWRASGDSRVCVCECILYSCVHRG